MRASAAAYQHALALYEERLSEYMVADDARHDCVIHFLEALGGETALVRSAEMLAEEGTR